MFKKYTPTAVAKNIYEIEPNFFIKNGIKTIFCDLDNTLDGYYEKEPTEQAINFYKSLRDNNIKLIIVSNNTKSRVEKYCKLLGCEFLYACAKPTTCKFKKYLKKYNYNLAECMIIGDQVFTDVLFANKLKIKSILCDNLVSKDQFFTKINKFFDKHVRNYLKKHNKLTNWREI